MATKKPYKAVNRTHYTQEMADELCQRICNGESVRTICKDETMPSAAFIFAELARNRPFAEQYARAKEVQADFYAEQIIEIADDGKNDTYLDEDGNKRTDQDVIGRSRLRVDARKWYAGKLAPKKYGDKLAIGGADDLPPIESKVDVTLNPSDAYLKMLGKK